MLEKSEITNKTLYILKRISIVFVVLVVTLQYLMGKETGTKFFDLLSKWYDAHPNLIYEINTITSNVIYTKTTILIQNISKEFPYEIIRIQSKFYGKDISYYIYSCDKGYIAYFPTKKKSATILSKEKLTIFSNILSSYDKTKNIEPFQTISLKKEKDGTQIIDISWENSFLKLVSFGGVYFKTLKSSHAIKADGEPIYDYIASRKRIYKSTYNILNKDIKDINSVLKEYFPGLLFDKTMLDKQGSFDSILKEMIVNR